MFESQEDSKQARILALALAAALMLGSCNAVTDPTSSTSNSEPTPGLTETTLQSSATTESATETTTDQTTVDTPDETSEPSSSIDLSGENELPATLLRSIIDDSDSKLFYSGEFITDESIGAAIQDYAIGLQEEAIGERIYENFFTLQTWHPETEASIEGGGFVIGTANRFFFVPPESEFVYCYDEGISQYYRIENHMFAQSPGSDANPHSDSLLFDYSASCISIGSQGYRFDSQDPDVLGAGIIEQYLDNYIHQDPINCFKISEYKIINQTVLANDEDNPTKLIINLDVIVVPESEENISYWFMGSGAELWEEDDIFIDQPYIHRYMLWAKDGENWIREETYAAPVTDFD